MSRTNNELAQLITKHLQQALTEHERQLLDAWIAEQPQNRAFLQSFENEQYMQQKLHTYHGIDRQRLWGLVQAKMAGEADTSLKRSSRIIDWLPYTAAAVLVIALVGTWLFLGDRITGKADGNTALATQTPNDVPPGGNKATLTLADGRTVDLSEAQAGIVVSEKITYLDGSTVIDHGQMNVEDVEGSRSNSITTPRGGTYQITLPDGSKVWLNAASTLRYPARFDGPERWVEIDGEAYFSIANDVKKPFRVFSRAQEIDVLGTEFNVSAYSDENAVKTTLVNGAVVVRNPASKRTSKLSPGQQSTIKGAETTIDRVETSIYTNWKNGVFSFSKTSAALVMKQVERWYDVEVVYTNGTPPTSTFSGEMNRDVSLRTVLEFLELSGISFNLEGRKLIIE